MNKKLSIGLIVASLILIIVNFITSEEYDLMFWVRVCSSTLIILAMLFSIQNKKNSP